MERENLLRRSIHEWFNSISHSSLIYIFTFLGILVSLLGSFDPKFEMMIILIGLGTELN